MSSSTSTSAPRPAETPGSSLHTRPEWKVQYGRLPQTCSAAQPRRFLICSYLGLQFSLNNICVFFFLSLSLYLIKIGGFPLTHAWFHLIGIFTPMSKYASETHLNKAAVIRAFCHSLPVSISLPPPGPHTLSV